MTPTAIDGFKKGLPQTLGDMLREIDKKIVSLDAQLLEQREARQWILGQAAAAGVELNGRRPGTPESPEPKLTLARE